MKKITERQKEYIKKLAKNTETEIQNIETLSSFAASQTIKGLVKKAKMQNGFRQQLNSVAKKDYSADVLAGLAVKIVAQKSSLERIKDGGQTFRSDVVELYKAFSSARRQCLA